MTETQAFSYECPEHVIGRPYVLVLALTYFIAGMSL